MPDPSFEEKASPVDADYVVEGISVTYKGKRLPFLEHVDKFVEIFGDNYRKRGDTIYIWEDLGVCCYFHLRSKKVVELKIYLRHLSKELRDELEIDNWTKQCYKKDIIVDGAILNKDTPIWKINKDKRGARFRKGPLPSSYEYSIGQVEIAGITTNVTYDIQLNQKNQVRTFIVSIYHWESP